MRICQEQGIQFDPQIQYWFDEVAKKIGPPVGGSISHQGGVEEVAVLWPDIGALVQDLAQKMESKRGD